MRARLRTLAKGKTPKYAKPQYRTLQLARKRLGKTLETAAKDAAKERDDYTCRRCRDGWFCGPGLVEAAHIRNAGAGGNPDGSRGHKAGDYVTLCHDCHQGPRSVHSGHLRIVAGLSGGDGVVTFEPVVGKQVRVRA